MTVCACSAWLRSRYPGAAPGVGFAEFTLWGTPTAIANTSSATTQCGPAPPAFIGLPLVSAVCVDLANAVIIQVFGDL